MTFPFGHSQPATHCLVQIGSGLAQVAEQAEPHMVKT